VAREAKALGFGTELGNENGAAGVNGDETKTKTKRAPANGGVVAGPAPVVERPFIVAADVKGAFDSIPLEALERVAAALVEAPAYDVQRLTRVTGGAGGVGVRAKTARHATRAFSREEDANASRDNSKVSSGGVCIDLASPTRVHRARVLELLHEHLRKNVVRSGGVYLLQKVGIPQGSVLSTLLCGVFYAHLESAHGLRDGGGVRSRDSENVSVSNEQETDGVLCRWTDDLLYVSAARAPAERFLKAATRGFEEHGCVMNAGKTSTNFDGRGERTALWVSKVRGLVRLAHRLGDFGVHGGLRALRRRPRARSRDDARLCGRRRRRRGPVQTLRPENMRVPAPEGYPAALRPLREQPADGEAERVPELPHGRRQDPLLRRGDDAAAARAAKRRSDGKKRDKK
jgi:hypothetical protein